MNPTWVVIVAVAGGVALFFGIFAFVIGLLRVIDARSGGWRVLAQHYATREMAPPEARHRQTVIAGAVRYKRSVTIGGTKRGLYLGMGPNLPGLRYPPLLVPWKEIQLIVPEPSRWRLGPGVAGLRLTIGKPAIGVMSVPADAIAGLKSFFTPEAAGSWAIE